MIQKNAIYECTISNLGHDGEGVGQLDGMTVFVPGALPGERVQVQMIKVKSSYCVAKLVKVITPSSDRINPMCAVYSRCGGCQLQHGTYAAQQIWKRDRVVQTLQRIGKQVDIAVPPVLAAKQPWGYRNKVQVPVGIDASGKSVSGFYARNSHEIVPFDTCPIQKDQSAELVQEIVKICDRMGFGGYDEATDRGWLRHVIVRLAERTNQWMVILVTRTASWPGGKASAANQAKLLEMIRATVPHVVSIFQNVNTKATNVVLGEKMILLWGKQQIVDELSHPNGKKLKFAISPHAFYQVNTAQMEVLYGVARRFAALTGTETVVDAYCGIGTIALFLAQECSKIYGVEIVPQAIEDAKDNARRNDVKHAEFEVGDAPVIMAKWHERGVKPDVIVLDPPRKGCATEMLESVDAMKPKRIVYVSCDIATFSRDAAWLSGRGWTLSEIQPVDLFPHTAHVEVVGLFVRANE